MTLLLLADTFTAALAKLPAHEAKAVKTTVFDLQVGPSGKAMSFHRIEASKDPNFRGGRSASTCVAAPVL